MATTIINGEPIMKMKMNMLRDSLINTVDKANKEKDKIDTLFDTLNTLTSTFLELVDEVNDFDNRIDKEIKAIKYTHKVEIEKLKKHHDAQIKEFTSHKYLKDRIAQVSKDISSKTSDELNIDDVKLDKEILKKAEQYRGVKGTQPFPYPRPSYNRVKSGVKYYNYWLIRWKTKDGKFMQKNFPYTEEGKEMAEQFGKSLEGKIKL